MDENRPNEPEGQQPPPPRPPETAVATAEPEPARRTSGMAIASLILSLTCIGALPALILGIVAVVQINRNRQRLGGEALAIIGIILGGIGILITPIFAAILFPVFARARRAAMQTNCLNNVKQLSMAMAMYQSDWDDTFPMTSNWNETLSKYAKTSGRLAGENASRWVCPAAKDKNVPSYAMNRALSGLKAGDVNSPADTVGIYESESGKDLANGPSLLPDPPRHPGGYMVGFADGHAKAVDESSASTLIWEVPAPTEPSPAPAPAPGQ